MASLLASFPCVTHCYERLPVPGKWDYTIYTVHHGYSRDAVLAEIRTLADHDRGPGLCCPFQYRRVQTCTECPESGRTGVLRMNRITQCLYGRGTVSAVMHHRHKPAGQIPSNTSHLRINAGPLCSGTSRTGATSDVNTVTVSRIRIARQKGSRRHLRHSASSMTLPAWAFR